MSSNDKKKKILEYMEQVSKENSMIIKAPKAHNGGHLSIFMCGEPTEWRTELMSHFTDSLWAKLENFALIDPKPVDPTERGAQLYYDWHHMRKAEAVIFYLEAGGRDREHVIYNLGKYLSSPKQIFVAADDLVDCSWLVYHAALEKPNLHVTTKLSDLAVQLEKWVDTVLEEPVAPPAARGQHVEI